MNFGVNRHDVEGRLVVSVGVRSLKGADSAIWTCDEDLDEMTTVAVAVDAARSFAEGMGFLFDEEDLGAGAPARAGWHDLMGDTPERDEPGEPPLELMRSQR